MMQVLNSHAVPTLIDNANNGAKRPHQPNTK
jgi:hypothetical protein